MTADLLADRDLALELHRLLSDIDPVRWRAEHARTIKPRLEQLQTALAQRPLYAELSAAIRASLPTLNDTEKQAWLAFKESLKAPYMNLARTLQAESIHVPSLRPTNHARSLFHVASAFTASVAIALLSPRALIAIAVAWAVFSWSCEISRRFSPRINALMMKVFGPVAHAHEAHRVNSATWYASALLLLSLTQSTALCLAGVAVLGVGDPIAALVGRRFGRVRLLHGRSLEGTLAFVGSAAAATTLAFSLVLPLSLGTALALAVAAAVAGAIAELISLRVDDNFSIPLSAAAGAWVAAQVLSVAL